jgi:hypothetical protein
MASDPFNALNVSCITAFGSAVTYQQGAGDPFTITGIVQKDTDEERHQDGVYARLFVRLADFPSRPDHGDEVTVNGVSYTVFEVMVDPTGAAWLRLRANS